MSAPRLLSRRALLAAAAAGALAPRVAAAQVAARIAALGGAVTEILYRLGAGGRIVAVDTTSLYPPEALREKPNVGYLRALSAEGLLAQQPDLIIAAEGAGPPAVLAQLREAGLRVETVAEPPSPEGVLDKIATVGRLAGLEREAEALEAEVRARFTDLAARRARIARAARALVVLSIQGGRTVVGGAGSSADGILTLAGIANAAAGLEGFKPMTDEAIVAAAPDAVVMMQNGPEPPKRESIFAPGTALGQTPAAAQGRLVAMDGLYLLGFGPRTPEAATDLMRALYPDLPRD
ncbi:iron complex transport system substrate-binding protein [Methylobacterium sp. UNC378MF]|uniref:heme/hemin ABC transporter substrate-binding protein n=1 Tax=Methylobacterium sp. UNC378MF TaxID=1502748 RepID=UPI00088C4DCE|nr:ABC transporter substrate-binding protein [Methylobacterium sp. UNC378MF]SDA27368.1 iron complex transport system substrate-binding protein [Methylobacterium sp. UNC378MF]